MTQLLWATTDRKNHLVQLAMKYKGRCLKGHPLCRDTSHHIDGRCQGHPLCSEIEHYHHVETRTEIASLPISPADVREGRAIAPYCHGIGLVELAHAVSGARPIGPKRVPVQHEELSDQYGLIEERVIDDWKAEDREARSVDRQLRQQTTPTGEVGRFGSFHMPGRRHSYDPIDVDKHIENRPIYRILGYGVNDKLRRFVKVSIPGTGIILQVDISNSIQEVSKSKRKRLRRHGFPVKSENALCKAAVAIWWAR